MLNFSYFIKYILYTWKKNYLLDFIETKCHKKCQIFNNEKKAFNYQWFFSLVKFDNCLTWNFWLNLSKRLLWIQWPTFSIFWEYKIKSLYFYNMIQLVTKNINGIFFTFIPFYNQIWLNIVVDDCHFSYNEQNWGKKKQTWILAYIYSPM